MRCLCASVGSFFFVWVASLRDVRRWSNGDSYIFAGGWVSICIARRGSLTMLLGKNSACRDDEMALMLC